MKYKIIFLDIDGTLTNSDKIITPKTKDALLEAARRGVILAIASGRPEKGVEYSAKELQLAENGGYILPFNGGIVRNAATGEIMYQKSIELDVMRKVYVLSKEYGVNFLTYKNGEILAETLDDEYINIESRINNMPVRKVDCVIDEVEAAPTKCLLTGEPEIAARAETAIRDAIGPENANIFRSEPFFVEVMPCGIDKAASIEAFIGKLGIDRSQVIACGDGFNDITMVRFAGLGVAMSNGCEEIRRCADYITENDNNHDGIAEVVEKFILN
ncbi:MAG: Cof-type HAD-IIB family hydrolase [Huintestinicola sp.]